MQLLLLLLRPKFTRATRPTFVGVVTHTHRHTRDMYARTHTQTRTDTVETTKKNVVGAFIVLIN